MVKKVITLFEEEGQGVQSLYNDVVIVALNIVNYDVHILVDNKSLVDALFYDTFSRMDHTSY